VCCMSFTCFRAVLDDWNVYFRVALKSVTFLEISRNRLAALKATRRLMPTETNYGFSPMHRLAALKATSNLGFLVYNDVGMFGVDLYDWYAM